MHNCKEGRKKRGGGRGCDASITMVFTHASREKEEFVYSKNDVEDDSPSAQSQHVDLHAPAETCSSRLYKTNV